MKRREFLRAFGLGAPCLALCGRGISAEKPMGRPNIIFILADDLGYGDLGCYGQKMILTPSLDRMAREGLRFTQHYAGSTVCAPSRCVLMTGLHTGHAFIRGNGKENLRPSDRTVPELLRGVGYRTILIGKWGLGHEGSTGVPTRKGFDEFFGYMDQHHAHNYYPQYLLRGEERVRLGNIVPKEGSFGQGVAERKVDYSHDLFIQEALQCIERQGDAPFFLYLALTIPHANNEAGKAGMEVPSLAPYEDRDWPGPQKAHAAMITRMDRDVGRIMEVLKARGMAENTVVFFSSDNGPHREGGADPTFFGSSGGLRGLKRDLYEGGIRVPLIAWWPDTIEPGRTTDHVSAFWDFFPTACQLAGAESPSGLDGISMVPILLDRGEKQVEHEYLYWEFHERNKAQALRMGDLKVIHFLEDDRIEVYNLGDDPGETMNIVSSSGQGVARARNLFQAARTPSERWRI